MVLHAFQNQRRMPVAVKMNDVVDLPALSNDPSARDPGYKARAGQQAQQKAEPAHKSSSALS